MIPRRLKVDTISVGHRFKKFKMNIFVTITGELAEEFSKFFNGLDIVRFNSNNKKERTIA